MSRHSVSSGHTVGTIRTWWISLLPEAELSLLSILSYGRVFVNHAIQSRARVLDGSVVMASTAVPGIRRSVQRSLSSSVLQCQSYCDAGLDDSVSQGSEASSLGDPVVDTPLSSEFPSAVPKIEAFGAQRPIYDRNAYPARSYNAVSGRVGQSRVSILKPQLTRESLNEEERPVGNCNRPSKNVAHESCHDFPMKRFVCRKELPMVGFAYGHGNRHLPSASTTSEAIAILKRRQQQGLYIEPHMFVDILKRCSEQKDLIATRQVHDYITQSGMQRQRYVATTLLNAFIKCGSLHDARQVFDGLDRTDRNVITWTVMIGAYAKSGFGVEAYRLFLQMKREGFEPNAITFVSILNASASVGALEWVKEVHSQAREAGLESNLRVGNALVHMYAKSGCISEARAVFDRLEKRDVITWSIMIGAYAESGCGVEAYRIFLQMQREGFIPNAITYMSILNASASAGALDWVKEVHAHVRRAGLESDLSVANALVHMYAKSGSIDDARLIFDRLKIRDVITWNTMIGGLAQHGCGPEALELFRNMNADGVKPDGTTFVAVLSACCHAGLLDDGRRLFLAVTQDYGIKPTVVHYTCMVDLLGRAGLLEEAKLFIDEMPVEPNGVTWQALLGACRTHGNVELGELAAKELLNLEPTDASGYVLLSNIYAAAGKWEKVSLVRTMMEKRGARKEAGRSWIEIDNKIHEFVQGDTSHPEAKVIYSVLKDLTEKLKAEGYSPDTQLVLQNICEEDKELALCSHSEKLAIAYGVLRIPLGKPIRVFKNLRVCSDCHTATKFISKVTGREIIARDANRFHHFKDGVCSCSDYW